MNSFGKVKWKLRYYGVKMLGKIPGFLDGDQYYCNLCGSTSRFFMSYGTKSKVAFSMIGSGVRQHCECPRCFSHDRFRWVYEVLLRYSDILSPERKRFLKIMHIAAEPGVKKKIREKGSGLAPMEYLTGDLERIYSDVKVDVTDMHQFENDSFDYFIINHVLEHVPDEKKAMEEIRRVLKPDGILFISFPMCLERKTFENAEIVSPSERLDNYGQEDHVRLYGTDSAERLTHFGFEVKPLTVKEQMSQAEYTRMGLIPEDTIFMCKKKNER